MPGIPLKLQWELVLQEANQLQYTEVIVINTLIMRPLRECSLLVLDEIHRMPATTFSRVFKKVKYQFLLGLTATLERLDGKHVMLKQYAPICDSVNAETARRNAWISRMTEYNLGITMTDEEKQEYDTMSSQYQKYFDKFDNDFALMKNCAGPCVPKKYTVEETNLVRFYDPPAVKRAKEVGWIGNNAQTAYQIIQSNMQLPGTQKRSVWGGDLSHPYHPEKLHIFAINAMKLSGKMKQFTYKLPAKLDTAEQLIRTMKVRFITFAEVVETADELSRRLGSEAVVYHSSLKTKIIDGKKVSQKKQKAQALKAYAQNEVRGVLSAKSLDEGADFPDLVLGLILSFTSAPRQRTQRNGRVGRYHVYENGQVKESVIVYIYVKETKEYYWLKKSQGRDPGVKWVDSANDILKAEGYLQEQVEV